MAADVNDISIDYEEDGIQIVKQLDKEVLSKGAWTTIIFKYKEWDRRKEEYGDDRFTIRRFRKMNGEYRPQSKFNISSKAQAEKIIQALSKWTSSESSK